MQSQASFNVFHVNHLNDISENPFRFAVGLEDRSVNDTRGAGCSVHILSPFPPFLMQKIASKLIYPKQSSAKNCH